MTDQEPKPNTDLAPYRLRDLADDKVIEVTTKGNIVIPFSLELLSKLVTVKSNDRQPDKGELMMFANAAIEQACNPYLNECWLVMMRGKYVPIIAAQKRVAKAQSLASYDGFEWGWIDKEGKRQPSGPENTAKMDDITGAWGRIFFKDRKVPFYHEIFRSEYPHTKNDRKITMLMKTLRDQIHKYAFANEMGNLCTENEPHEMYEPLPAPECDTPARGDRRKKVKNMSLTNEDGSKVEGSLAENGVRGDRHAEELKPEPQEVAGTESEKPVVPETDESADGTAGLSLSEVMAKYVDAGGADFKEFAAEVLCRDEEEVERDEQFTQEMLGQLLRHIETESV